MRIDRAEQNRLSAEWAAYGDALGFVTELADSGRLQYRTGTDVIKETTNWRRKIGGYNGVNVDLPAGTYSDDTQLRLSTSRAIRADGSFDVAAFAKVELPAWANYALGAGVGSKEAAANLARTSATWYSNFFDTKRASYFNAGGNGAAMRVQPHVWAARDLHDRATLLLDVVRNSVCTHGHARGILGACFHALTLAFAMTEGRAAGLPEARQLVEDLRQLPDIVHADGDLRLFWVGAWEDASKTSFEDAVQLVVTEMLDDIEMLTEFQGQTLSTSYQRAAEAVGGMDQSSRGSGTKTAILAAFASSAADTSGPNSTLVTLINALGTDTDSIATMAGAILGACTERACDGALQDREYIRSEADRLAAIADERPAATFRYPDLRSWKPARAAVDAVGLVEGNLWLIGLGELEPLDLGKVKNLGDETLGWCRLSFGQTILARVRANPQTISPQRLGIIRASHSESDRAATPPPERLRDLFSGNGNRATPDKTEPSASLEGLTLSETLQRIIAEGFPPAMIGQALLLQVDAGNSDFTEKGIALAANVLTAYEARAKRRRR